MLISGAVVSTSLIGEDGGEGCRSTSSAPSCAGDGQRLSISGADPEEDQEYLGRIFSKNWCIASILLIGGG